MSPYTIHIDWTDFLPKDAPELNKKRSLYMYATEESSFWIGKAGGENTPWNRWKSHEKDRVQEWIGKNVHSKYPCGIKVGCPRYDLAGFNYSKELLRDIESLLIISERQLRGCCLANIKNTITRNIYRPGMTIINRGDYWPLWRTYVDDEGWHQGKLKRYISLLLSSSTYPVH
jgi:hypothetical protein